MKSDDLDMRVVLSKFERALDPQLVRNNAFGMNELVMVYHPRRPELGKLYFLDTFFVKHVQNKCSPTLLKYLAPTI